MRWLDVRAGERARVARASLAMFALLCGFTLAETARDSLFLGSGGREQLAAAYLILATLSIGAVVVNTRLVKRMGRRRALVTTLVVAAAGTSCFAVPAQTIATSFALYVWSGLVGTLVIVQFWLLAATRFTSTEAKRLFGLISACGALGTLSGALLATAVLTAFSVKALLPLAGGFYVVAAILLLSDRESVESRLQSSTRKPASRSMRRNGSKNYVLRLSTFVVCATAAAILADYLFKTVAASRYETHALAHFIAKFNAIVALLSLALQVFGAAWLVKRAGVLGIALVLPTLLLGGAVFAFVAGSFIAVCATKAVDGSLRYSVNRVGAELLWLPVPEDLRGRVREPLESVGTRGTQAIVAVVLIALGVLDLANLRVVGGMLIGIVAVWFGLAASLRGSYLAQLRSSIGIESIRDDDSLDTRSVAIVFDALSSVDDRKVIAALQILRRRARQRLVPALILRHPSAEVLKTALDTIATPDREDWQPLARILLESRASDIRQLALGALAKAGDEAAIIAGLCDADAKVVALAMFWQLQTHSDSNIDVQRVLQDLGTSQAAEVDHVKSQLLDAIRDHGDARWGPVVAAIARAPGTVSIQSLALAMAHIPDPKFIPFLIARLDRRNGRAEVRAALVACGEAALDRLDERLADASTERRVRLHIPGSIAGFASERAASVLARHLEHEQSGAIRYRILRALALMAERHELIVDAAVLLRELERNLRDYDRLLGVRLAIVGAGDASDSSALLDGVLADKTSQALDRAFLVLQALHPREPMRAVARAMASTEVQERAHGMELLDTLTRSPLYEGARGARIRELMATVIDAHLVSSMDPESAMVLLLGDRDELLAACAAYRALQLSSPNIRAELARVSEARDVFRPLGLVPARLRVA